MVAAVPQGCGIWGLGQVVSGKTLKEIGGRVALVVVSTLVSLLVLEVGIRVSRDPSLLWRWDNLIARYLRVEGGDDCTHVYDPLFGWRPGRNVAEDDYHTGPDGFRLTPRSATDPLAGPTILATGSSFTAGDEVADNETWPAYLQQETAHPVINAGVSSFALDQSVLYTQTLAARMKPGVVVVGFTPLDIENLEWAEVWSADKPYFQLTEVGRLELKNVPVPFDGQPCEPPRWARLFGWSALVDLVSRRLDVLDRWYFTSRRAMPEGAGERLLCPLMARLHDIGAPVLVVAHVGRSVWEKPRPHERRRMLLALDCARKAGLDTLDLFPVLEKSIAEHGLDAYYRGDHHSPAGNRLIAGLIAEKLKRLNASDRNGARLGTSYSRQK